MQEKEITNIHAEREKIIIKSSIIGIATNLLLSLFKAVIGLVSNSIAILLDSVNNLSDALSSIITIIGTKLSGKEPNIKHPLGYGRIEYLTTLLVAGLVLYAGITAGVESIKKIIHPETANYSIISLIIIAVAVVVKLLLGNYVKKQGKKAHSGALVASGEDARFDAILSLSVLASAIIYLLTGLSLEAYVGIIISVFIIKSGVEMMTDTLNDLLGKRTDAELAKKIKKLLSEEPEVRGAFDLLLHNYGPNKNYASVHLELPDTMTVEEVDNLTRKLQEKVFKATDVVLTGVGVYSYNTKNNKAAQIRDEVQKKVLAHEWAKQFHGFFVDTEKKEMRFDVVMSFDIPYKKGLKTIYEEIGKLYPDYHLKIAPDIDL